MKVLLIATLLLASATSSAAPVALRHLDAMLDEIDAAWRKNQETIRLPKARPGFEVAEMDGVPMLVPRGAKLTVAEVTKHLQSRAKTKKVKNARLQQYTSGALVPVGPDGQKATVAPVALALNDTLVIFVIPTKADPQRVNRIEVALP